MLLIGLSGDHHSNYVLSLHTIDNYHAVWLDASVRIESNGLSGGQS